MFHPDECAPSLGSPGQLITAEYLASGRVILSRIADFLPLQDILRGSTVSKSWRAAINSDPILWQSVLHDEGLWFGRGTEHAFVEALRRRRRGQVSVYDAFQILCRSRYLTRNRWATNQEPKHIAIPNKGSNLVTCLLLSQGRVISADDDGFIYVYSLSTGQLLHKLEGHEGGIWPIAAFQDTLASGGTDRTVRVWQLSTGRCTHVFGGHTSTVRCLAIVKPEWIDVGGQKEIWPKRPIIVSGSRDSTLRTWAMPRPGDPEYKYDHALDDNEEDANDNPYYRAKLVGHDQPIRALAVRGRTAVSGSYDSTVRVWDIVTGTCKWILEGHTQKVYSVALDPSRQRAFSGSMDGTVRVWDTQTGDCVRILTGHTSLVALLGISPSFLVSAAADATVRVWNPDTGEVHHTLEQSDVVTSFQHDETKIVSGAIGALKVWNVRDGTLVHDLLTTLTGLWQVVFEGRWCVAASNRSGTTFLDVWDFGNGEEDVHWIGEPADGVYDEYVADNVSEHTADDVVQVQVTSSLVSQALAASN